ncbi:MAG: cytochrome c family protein [Micropepsaceae bacterium]
MRLIAGLAGLLALTVSAAADPVATDITGADGQKMMGDPVAGEKSFAKCRACHSTAPGDNKIGPTLYGVIGRLAGTVEGYNYSKPNKESGITWTEQEMFDYLENPRKKIPGTKMAFAGIKKPEERADLIAWLQEDYKAQTAATP